MAIIAQLLVGVFWGGAGVLFFGGAFFAAVLSLPLIMLTAMFPAVAVDAEGLTLSPMLGGRSRILWAQIAEVRPHPLLYDNESAGRLMHGRGYQPRRGVIVLVQREARLPLPYHLVGRVCGSPLAGFGISTSAHTGYDQLVRLIEERL